MKSMPFPLLGGRVRPGMITENLARNLNLKLDVRETTSKKKAWENVKSQIDLDRPVALKLDCYHLDYFTQKFHFAAHYVAMYGYDADYAYLVDTAQQGQNTKSPLRNLELARAEKGPMSSKNLSYTIAPGGAAADLPVVLRRAIIENARDYLAPPIQNISYKGIAKAAEELPKWYRSAKDSNHHLRNIALFMEKAGTGGALFRNLYRDFLKECTDILKSAEIERACQSFVEIARLWTDVAGCLHQAGKANDLSQLEQACKLLVELSIREKAVMEKLTKLA
jgi:hypothetical protein